MKFELTETVAVANPEEVLRVLEQHLRAVAGDVVRTEGQVTAFGIGPSPRTVNRRDTTVIDAREVDGQTILSVQVNYQASALLGNMPQDGIVRSKIEGAIDEMRGELKVWKPWGRRPGWMPPHQWTRLRLSLQRPSFRRLCRRNVSSTLAVSDGRRRGRRRTRK